MTEPSVYSGSVRIALVEDNPQLAGSIREGLAEDGFEVDLHETAAKGIATVSDEGARRFIRLLLNVVPDVDSSDLMAYVAEGFNIGPAQIIVTSILVFGYVAPWFLLGYYLMKWREIASAN